jgi:hypothetical protein
MGSLATLMSKTQSTSITRDFLFHTFEEFALYLSEKVLIF